MLRGALNAALMDLYCRRPNRSGRFCTDCTCLYGLLEGNGALPPEIAGKFSELPAPIVFRHDEHGGSARKGHEVRFLLTVFGKVNAYLPLLIAALGRAAKEFMTHDPGNFTLARVVELDGQLKPQQLLFEDGMPIALIPAHAISIISFPEAQGVVGTLTLDWDPMAILYKKEVPVTELDAVTLLERLLNRMALLATCYCDAPWQETADLAKALGADIETVRDLTLQVVWPKHDSGRDLPQGMPKRWRNIPGLTGSLTFRGDDLRPILPLLSLGQWVHVGKLPVFGMGGYRVSVQRD